MSQKSVQSENGVYIVILSLIIVTIIGIGTFLGIRPTIIKSNASHLKVLVDSICGEIAAEPIIQAQAKLKFDQAIADIDIPYLKVTQANLVIPSLLNSSNNPMVEKIPPNSTGICKVCNYYGDIRTPSSTYTNAYPRAGSNFLPSYSNGTDFWDQDHNAGNIILCEVFADFEDTGLFSFFTSRVSDEKKIKEKSIHAISVVSRTIENIDNIPNGIIPERERDSGLRIIVAPHMITRADHERFQFDRALATDPIASFDPNDPTLSIFSATPPSLPSGSGILEIPALSIPENTKLRNEALPLCSGQFQYSDRSNAITACMNPAVLVRNIFLSTLINLASRTGNLHRNTGVYLAGTQHTVANDIDGLPVFWNPPIELIAPGDDLMTNQFSLPFVSFYNPVRTSNDPSVFPILADRESDPLIADRNGWILPFYDGTASHDEYFDLTNNSAAAGKVIIDKDFFGEMRAMISSQLRNCFHLYRGTGNNSINIDIDSARLNYTPHLDNQLNGGLIQFEDPKYASFSDINSFVSLEQWSQGETNSEKVNGVNLMKILGTIQFCPYEMGVPAGTPSDYNPNTNYAPYLSPEYIKPAPGDPAPSPLHNYCSKSTTNLKPDLLAALAALNEATTVLDDERHVILESPGLYARDNSYRLNDYETLINTPSLRTATKQKEHALVFSPGSYKNSITAGDDYSITLMVTHKNITDIEAIKLRELVDSYNTHHRPVHIVFIPTHGTQVSQSQTDKFRAALMLLDRDVATLGANIQGLNFNSFTEISPYTDEFEGSGNFSYDSNDDDNFQNFWHELLLNNGDNDYNIIRRAEAFFYYKLLGVRRRL